MYNISIPASFEALNAYSSSRSVAGQVVNDDNTAYFMRSLYDRLISGAKFKLPKAWSQGERYFKNVLFSNGFIGIFKTEKYGVIPQFCTPSGYGLFMQPTNLIVAQPLVNMTGTIGEDCEVIHLTNDWSGVWDIVEHYAIRLSTAITSVDCSLMISRLAILAGAKNKSASETLKYLFQQISAGNPFNVYDKELKDTNDLSGANEPIWTEAFNVKDNYITDKLLENIETIMHQFDAEVGILSGTSKKERMITDEVTANSDDTCARASSWYTNLEESFDKVNDLFPDLNLGFTLRFGGEEREYNAENDPNRVV